MTIHIGSRYASSGALVRTPILGQVRSAVFRDEVSLPSASKSYVVVEGDRLDNLAAQFLGKAELWWVIADANRELLLPDPLIPGTVLLVPDAF